ncbi:MAG TPA: GlsB/YeaQ/YmgE family stress response membrane protein [Trebonia sp.]
MGIIAWIVLGLGAGLLANLLIPGRRSQGLFLTCVIGVAGALAGGWAATRLFHVHTLNGFFNLSTWLTAIVGAAILLLVFHLLMSNRGTTRRAGTRRAGSRRTGSRRARWAHR